MPLPAQRGVPSAIPRRHPVDAVHIPSRDAELDRDPRGSAPRIGYVRGRPHYPFLPEPPLFPREPPDPPTAGWWWDPFDAGPSFTQRYHDGTRWTQYACYQAGKLWSDVVESPPENRTQARKDQNVFTNVRTLGLWFASLFIGGFLLALSSAFDVNSTPHEWVSRAGIFLFLGAFAFATVTSIQVAARSGRGASDWAPVAIFVFLLVGIIARQWNDVLSAFWLR
jgi:hypothetical protein